MPIIWIWNNSLQDYIFLDCFFYISTYNMEKFNVSPQINVQLGFYKTQIEPAP